MIRVVCDTNIIVSGFLWTGAPSDLIDAALEEKLMLLASEALLAELTTVLSRPKFQPQFAQLGKSVQDFMANYRALIDLIKPAPIEPVINADPTDDAVLACALTGKADYIVSGDKHLLTLGSYSAIPILTINQFMDKLSGQ